MVLTLQSPMNYCKKNMQKTNFITFIFPRTEIFLISDLLLAKSPITLETYSSGAAISKFIIGSRTLVPDSRTNYKLYNRKIVNREEKLLSVLVV